MTEALFYPLVATALVALARMLEQPTLERQGLFLLAVSVAAAVRLQALVLLPALLVAVALYAWFGRSGAILRRLAPILALVGFATAAFMAVALSGRSDLLGAYGEITQTTGASSGAVAQFTWHAGVVVAMTLGLPLLATTTLVVLAMVRGEEDPAARAFLAVTAAYVVMLVAQVSLFAVEHLDHVSERYMITALPLLVLGLCLWISRAGPRPAVIAVPVTVAALTALLVLPQSRVGTTSSAHDALTLLPLGSLAGEGDAVFRGGLLALGLVFAAVFLLTPRRFLAAIAVAVAVGFVAASVHAAREIDRLSHRERVSDFGSSDPQWVDAAGAAPVLLLDTGEQPSTSIARLAFWNSSIRDLRRLDGVPAQALPQQPVTIRSDGALVDSAGEEVSAPHVLLPATHALDGERLASSPPTDIAPGYGLWRVDSRLRLVSRTEGFTPVGDFGRAKVVVYPCGPGALEVTLLGKEGSPVRLGVNGFPWRTVDVEQGEIWSGAVPSLRPAGQLIPCLFELESDGLVGSYPGRVGPGKRLDVFELVVQRNLRLDRVARVVDLGLGDEDLERRIVERLGVVLDRGLQLRLDAGRGEKPLQLLRFGHVTCDCHLYEPRHGSWDPIAASAPRSARAPARTSSGAPRSGKGIWTRSKSRGTTVSGKSSRASATTSWPK